MELHYERNVHRDTLPEEVSTSEMCYHWSANFRADNYCFHGLHFTTVQKPASWDTNWVSNGRVQVDCASA